MKSELMKKEVGYYMQLAYTIIMRRDDDGDFVARIGELPGCAAHDATPNEALDNLTRRSRNQTGYRL